MPQKEVGHLHDSTHELTIRSDGAPLRCADVRAQHVRRDRLCLLELLTDNQNFVNICCSRSRTRFAHQICRAMKKDPWLGQGATSGFMDHAEERRAELCCLLRSCNAYTAADVTRGRGNAQLSNLQVASPTLRGQRQTNGNSQNTNSQ